MSLIRFGDYTSGERSKEMHVHIDGKGDALVWISWMLNLKMEFTKLIEILIVRM